MVGWVTMNPVELASSLHENERRILRALAEKGEASTEELSRATGLTRDAVEKASDWAATKGVLTFQEETQEFFQLTQEGQQYAQEGLPERRLLEALRRGPMRVEMLKDSFPGFMIGLGWLRRLGLAQVEAGEVRLTEKGLSTTKLPGESVLAKLGESGKLEGAAFSEEEAGELETLVKRGLARRSRVTHRQVTITELGRKVLDHLGEERKVVTQITPGMLSTGSWRGAQFQAYDVTLPVPRTYPGKRHFISQIIDYIRRFWVELGFKEMKGEYLELNFWNFDALYQPQDHPARDLADTFYMKTPYMGRLPDPELVRRVKETHENGWTTGSRGWRYKWDPELAARTVLRTHTTSLSVQQIAKLKPEDLPGKFFSVGRVFRNETIDWNHLAEFYQTDGIVIGEGVTFRDMQGYLKTYLEGLGLEKFRFRPGYFPYTEMSMEAEVWIEERGSWMELFGAGMFRPEVVKPLIGIDVPVLAWGPGFDRLIMQSYHIESIRELYSNDIGMLRAARLWVR